MWILLYIFFGVPCFLSLYLYVAELNFRRLNYSHGCTPPKYQASFPFGIPALVHFAISYRDNNFHPYTQSQYYSSGALTFREQSLGRTLLNTIEPENIKTVLATQFDKFDLAVRHDQFQPMMGDGIFTLSGKEWHKSRVMLKPQFTLQQVSRLDSLVDHVESLIDIIDNKHGAAVDIQQLFFALTLDVATEMLFGESTNVLSDGRGLSFERKKAAQDFAKHFAIGQKYMLYRTVAENMYWVINNKEYKEAVRICHEFVDYYVRLAIENPEDDRYVFLKELSKETTDQVQMRDQAMSVLLAGRDTTAGLLSFSMALMLRHKDVWFKLREAVLSDFDNGIENISFRTLKRCNYLQYVMMETLRLFPVVPINSRSATKDVILPLGGGMNGDQPIYVPKGTIVQYHTYSLHRHPKFWGTDSEEFNPMRWASIKGSEIPWTFIPFNGGPRICIGQMFALTEAGYALTRLAQTYSNIEPVGRLDPEIKQKAGLTSSVAGGVQIVFTK